MDFKKMEIDDIIKWCQENEQVEWLKKISQKKVIAKRHTARKKVYNEKKQKWVWVADKTSPIKEVETPISYVQIKLAFCKKFMPDIIPEAKEKEPTMFDKIAAL